LMGFERERRSIGFERADEEKNGVREGMKGLGLGITDLEEKKEEKAGEEAEEKRREEKKEKVPNVSLMGLSMLGSEFTIAFSLPPALLHVQSLIIRKAYSSSRFGWGLSARPVRDQRNQTSYVRAFSSPLPPLLHRFPYDRPSLAQFSPPRAQELLPTDLV